METTILIYWLIFNILYGGVEYIFYLQQQFNNNEIFLWGRKIILPFIKILISFIIAYTYSTYEFNNEIFINGFGIYFLGSIFQKGSFFQIRRLLLGEDEFHFFSHSINTLIGSGNITWIDVHAFGRILITILGYSILFIEYS